MADLKINSDLFLESQELNRLVKTLDAEGFRKNVLDNSVSFGLIKSNKIPAFVNGRVTLDTPVISGNKTVKVFELAAIDSLGRFLTTLGNEAIPIPTGGAWYWIKATYATDHIELGNFTLSANGDLVDISGKAELTKILRGMPNFPVKIKFSNSSLNTLEYECLEVIDDTHATLQHPATNSNGISEFAGETGLKLQVVGCFTQGVAVPTQNKFIYNKDSVVITAVLETFPNTRPAYTVGRDFYLARVRDTGATLEIQDKRIEYWETKGSNQTTQIQRTNNAAIGIESIKFNSEYSASDENITTVAWGVRSANWSVDTSQNLLTFASGSGGKFKSVTDFTNGDCDGNRLYFPNGKYAKVFSSVKQGSAINFFLDVLDIDNLSGDGGVTFNAGTINVVPDCDVVEFKFTPAATDLVSSLTKTFSFSVNELTGRCDVIVYKDTLVSPVLYNVQYRYKSLKEFTGWQAIPTDLANGYLTEASFDVLGNAVVTPVRYPYNSHPTNGFISYKISPFAIKNFRSRIDKGDLIGVTEITNLLGVQNYNLKVGLQDNYQLLTGNIVLDNDVFFNLLTDGAKEGNQFVIHINCNTIDFASQKIYIGENVGTPSQRILKTINVGDYYHMKNQDGGLSFTLKYKTDNTAGWVMSQNYDLGVPFQYKYMDGIISSLFDPTTGKGIVKGYFGYVVCDTSRTVDGIAIHDLSTSFLAGANSAVVGFTEGSVGGSETHIVTKNNIQKFNVTMSGANITGGVGWPVNGSDPSDGTIDIPVGVDSPTPINHTPKYYAVIIAKRIY